MNQHSATWAGYTAAAWAVIFAAMSFYWAAGGIFGTETLAADLDAALGELAAPWFVALTGLVKLLGALLALVLAPPWTQRLPRRLLLTLGWVVGGGLVPYALLNLGQHALMVFGAIETPDALGSKAARWHLFFWDPWWLLGGLLFLMTARASRTMPCLK